MSIEPGVASPEEPYAIREEDLPKIMEEYDKLAVEYIKRQKEGRGFNFFHFMLDLNQGPCVAKRLSGCGSGTEYLAVTPWGDLYPCHQFVGEEKFLLGNVDDGITNTEVRDEFKLCNVYAKDKCRRMRGQFLQFPRFHSGRIRHRMRDAEEADRVRNHDQGRIG